MKNYVVNIFKTYKLWFISSVLLNYYISLNVICYALFGFNIVTTNFVQTILQTLIWIVTFGVICISMDVDYHKHK